jgi:hypothetical protein
LCFTICYRHPSVPDSDGEFHRSDPDDPTLV